LRAPLECQLRQAQAMLVIGAGSGAEPLVEMAQRLGLRIFRGRLRADCAAVAALTGHKALAFAGIGDPDKFFVTLNEAGIAAPVCRAFGDHHRYGSREAAALLAQANREGLVPLTTEKDAARLAGDPELGELAQRAKVLPVSLVPDEGEEFGRFVLTALSRASS
jgi:tetraacyldisaccharide 4'-kinase